MMLQSIASTSQWTRLQSPNLYSPDSLGVTDNGRPWAPIRTPRNSHSRLVLLPAGRSQSIYSKVLCQPWLKTCHSLVLIMARIHDLPVEILQCIFILACEIDEAPLDRANDYTLPRGAYLSAIGVRLDRPATSADRLRKPRLKFLAYELRRTCLHWMEVVDSTPELQYIVARVGRPSRNIPEVAKRITENPLVDIDLIFASVYPLPGEDLNKLMDILRPCKSRIRYIEAVGCSFRLCSQIITALNNFEVLPNLQWMELGLNTNVLLSGRVQAMLTVEAPALRHLVLRKVEPVTLNRLDLITNHDRVLFPPNSCGPFLHTTSISTKASYSHILRLRFHLPPDYFLHPLHSETIEFDLPNVHSILLEADSICTIRFLQRIHAPQLKRLVVKRYRGRGGPEDWRLEPVANHLPTLAEILVQGFNTEIFAPFLLRRITSPVLRRVVIGRQTVTKIIGLLEVLCEDPAVGMMRSYTRHPRWHHWRQTLEVSP